MPSHVYRTYTPIKTKVDPALREKIKAKIFEGYARATKKLNRKVPAKKHIAIMPPVEIENFASALWHELAHALKAHQHHVRVGKLSIDPTTGSGAVEIWWVQKGSPHQRSMVQAEISLAGVYADKTIRLEADTYWAVHDLFEAYVSLMYGEMAADNAQNLFLNLFTKQLEAEKTGIQGKITEPLDRIFSVLDQVLLQLENSSGWFDVGTKPLASLRTRDEVEIEIEKLEGRLEYWFQKNELTLFGLVEVCSYNFAISGEYTADINQIINNLPAATSHSG